MASPNLIAKGWPSAYLRSKNNYETEIETTAFKLFRQFLIFKIVIPFAFIDGIHWPFNSKTLVILFILFVSASGLSRCHFLGLLQAFLFSGYQVWVTSPFTINHFGLEFGIVLLMTLMPDEEQRSETVRTADLIKILMLSVWFFSGIHKLLDGYYLNGEFFALAALSNQSILGGHLNDIINFFGRTSPFGFCCNLQKLDFTPMQMGILLCLSWLTILVEISLPMFFLLWPSKRPLLLVGLFMGQGIIAYFSGEIDFAFTAFAILLLFVPKIAQYAYPCLAFLFLVVKPWI